MADTRRSAMNDGFMGLCARGEGGRSLVSRPRDSRNNCRAGHPRWRRCDSVKYARYFPSSRLAIGAPRSGTYTTNYAVGTLAAHSARHAGRCGTIAAMGTSAPGTERLQRWIAGHRRVFALTGAGCSTASGIPDYRDDQGEWKRRPPVMIQAFRAEEAVYRRYWARAYAGWR